MLIFYRMSITCDIFRFGKLSRLGVFANLFIYKVLAF